jgi:hypothetical protein
MYNIGLYEIKFEQASKKNEIIENLLPNNSAWAIQLKFICLKKSIQKIMKKERNNSKKKIDKFFWRNYSSGGTRPLFMIEMIKV